MALTREEMEKRYNKRRAYLKEQLSKLKAENLRVFINKPDQFLSYNYGLISDGTDIIYVQYCNEYEKLFETSYLYIPGRDCGSGAQTLEEGTGYTELNADVFREAVKTGRELAQHYRAGKYESLEQYMKDSFNKKNYEEL